MPTFANQQVQVEALGLAVHGDDTYYLSAAGPKAALKSLWASLVANSGKKPYSPSWHWQRLNAAGSLKQLWSPLPRSNAHHLVLRSMAPHLLLIADPAAATLDGRDTTTRTARQARLNERLPQAHQQLVAYLEGLEFPFQNAPARLPLLAAWGAPLWEYALHHSPHGRGLCAIEAFGDCLGAWLIDPRYPWLDVIGALIKTGQLTW
jgi:hypothetical protein